MNHVKKTFLSAVVFISLPCAGGDMPADTLTSSIIDACVLAQEICADARTFQEEYGQMPKKQQKQMVPVLNNYIEQCEQMTAACKQSPDTLPK